MRTGLMRTAVATAAVGLVITGLSTPAAAVGTPVPIQLVAMNDFHGRIDAYTGADSTLQGYADPAGGAMYIPPLIDKLNTGFTAGGGAPENSLFVGAGDLISASPFESSSFKDEPTIEVLNALGLDLSSVGNHEFDRGTTELNRIQNGGCVGTPGVDSCFRDGQYGGADFPYLAANVVNKSDGAPVLPPYFIKEFNGPNGVIKMGFIGIVTSNLPALVSPGGIATVDVLDESTTINKYAAELKGQGVEAIAVLIHEGGEEAADVTYNNCDAGFTGPIVDINNKTTADVDLFVSAHTHFAYTCVLNDPAGNPRHVTEAGSYGRLLTDIQFDIDSETGDVIRTPANDTVTAVNNPVARVGVTPDPAVQTIVDYWKQKSAVKKDEVIGQQTAAITRAGTPPGASRADESTLGNLIADAQLWSTQAPENGGAVLAIMNPGGIRSDLNYTAPVNGLDPITYGEAFNVQPFGNTLVTEDLTGADIKLALEQQWSVKADGTEQELHLSVSQGFSYVYDESRPIGDRVDPNQMILNGQKIDLNATYRVTVNSFLAEGGDGFLALDGDNKAVGAVDVDAFAAYATAKSPLSPPAIGRTVAGKFIEIAAADLKVVSVKAPTVITSKPVAVPVKISNHGTGPNSGPVTVSTDLLGSLAFAGTQPAGCTVSGQKATCTVTTLASGGSTTINLVVKGTTKKISLGAVLVTVSGKEAPTANKNDNFGLDIAIVVR